jgi:Leucine-rich repeat (LRR) protein
MWERLGVDLICNIAEFLDPVEIVCFRLINSITNKRVNSHWNKILPIYDILPYSDESKVTSALLKAYRQAKIDESDFHQLPFQFPDSDKYDLSLRNIFKCKNWNTSMTKISLSDHQTLAPELEKILNDSMEGDFKVMEEFIHPNKAVWIAYCLDQVFPGIADHHEGQNLVIRLFIRGAKSVKFCPCVLSQASYSIGWNSEIRGLTPYKKFFLWPYLQEVLFLASSVLCGPANVQDYPRLAKNLCNILTPKIRVIDIRGIRCFNLSPGFNAWRYIAEGKRLPVDPILIVKNFDTTHRSGLPDMKQVFRLKLEHEMAPPSSFSLLNLNGIEKSKVTEVQLQAYELVSDDMLHFAEGVTIRDWSQLKSLTLSHNNITTSGFIMLIQANSFISLETLDVSHNQISCSAARSDATGDTDSKQFMEFPEQWPSTGWSKNLKHLNMTQNSVTNAGFKFIVSMFTGLQVLNCTSNFISDDVVAEAFHQPIFSNRTLKKLILAQNSITVEGLDAVINILSKQEFKQDRMTINLKKMLPKNDRQTWVDAFEQFNISLEF